MSERLRAVVERLDIRSDDRSAKMVRAAMRRNAPYVEAGRAAFLAADLEDLELGDRRFGKILAVRVGLFHREPERARRIVEPWLAPGGKFFVIHDEPSASGTSEVLRRRPRRGYSPENPVRRSKKGI